MKDRFGEPWPYVLKKVLQFGNDLDSAINLINETHRTCSLYIGVGSASDK